MQKFNKIKLELFFKVLLFFVTLFSVALIKNNLILLVELIVILLIGIKLKLNKYDIPFFIVGALAGSTGEIICTYFKCWKYANPTFFGIPIWVPVAWGIVFLLIKRTLEILNKKS